MTDTIISNAFWLQILRFLIGSTFLLSTVWLIERSQLIKNFRLRTLFWKLALFGSLLFLIPFSSSLSPVFRFETTENRGEQAETNFINRQSSVDSNEAASLFSESSLFEKSSSENLLPRNLTTKNEIYAVVDDVAQASPSQSIPAVAPRPEIKSYSELPFPTLPQLPLSNWLLLIWCSLSLVAFLRLYFGYKRGLGLLGKRELLSANDELHQLMHAMRIEAGLRRTPRLTRSAQIASPVTLLGNEICLPLWVTHSLPRSELKGLLAHELGHIQNRDLLYLLGTQLLSCIFFFQPLFYLARNRLLDLSEFLADESALQQCQSKDAVANALVNCADRVRTHQSFQWGFAMVGNTSRLKQRVEQLQSIGIDSIGKIGRLASLLSVALVSAVILLVPNFEHGYAAENVFDQNQSEPLLLEEGADLAEESRQASPLFAQLDQQALTTDIELLVNSSEQVINEQEQLFNDREQLLLENVELTEESQRFSQLLAQLDRQEDQLLANKQSINDREQLLNEQEQLLNEREQQLAAQFESELLQPQAQLARSLQQLTEQQALLLEEYNNLSLENELLEQEAEVMSLRAEALAGKMEAQLAFSSSANSSSYENGASFGRFFRLLGFNYNSYDSSNGKHSWSWDEGKARWTNQLTINDAEDSIIAISDNGRFEYNSTVGPRRRIVFDANGSNVTSTFWRGGDESPMQLEDREWFHDVLIQLMRQTGVDAEARVSRLLGRGGPSAVITELHYIGSDQVAGRYNELLLENTELNQDEIGDLLQTHLSIGNDLQLRSTLTTLVSTQDLNDDNLAAMWVPGDTIGNDLEKRLLIFSVIEEVAPSEFFTNQLLQATVNIGNDLEDRLALSRIVERGAMNEANWTAFNRAASTIGNDLEKRMLIFAIADAVELSVFSTDQLFKATLDIGNDLEDRLALIRIVEKGVVNDSNWNSFGQASNSIGNDLEMRILLTRVAQLEAGESVLGTQTLIRASYTIGNDLEQRSALVRIAEYGQMDDANWRELFDAMSTIGNDLEARRTIVSLVDQGAESELVAELALASLASIGNDLEMRKAVSAIAERGSLSTDSWSTAILSVQRNIGNQHERNLAFKALAEVAPDDAGIKDRILDVLLE